MAEQERDTPKDIPFDCVVVDIACHPSKDYVAVGLIDGAVKLYSYSSTKENHELMSFSHHKKTCRALTFSSTGEFLYTVSKDKSLQVVDLEKGAVKHAISKAHKSAIYSLLNVNDNIVATGDDDGVLKVWDLRLQKPVMESKEIAEFISDMAIESNNRILVAASGEGTLTAFDIRKHKMKVQSELFDSEFLSLAIMKHERKVVCGTGEGVINIFNWSEWGNISDRFPGHPMSVDCIVKLNEDIIFTGSMDGIIRAVNVLPNRFLGMVGQHEDFPVENMSLSHCSTVLASCSHDSCVKFWDVKDVTKQKINVKRKAKRIDKNKAIKKTGKGSDFFSDLADPAEDDNNDDSDDDDDDTDDDSDSDSDNERPQKKIKSGHDDTVPSDKEAVTAPTTEDDRLQPTNDSDTNSDGSAEGLDDVVGDEDLTSDDGLSDEENDSANDGDSDEQSVKDADSDKESDTG